MSSPVNSHAPPRQPPTTSGGGAKPPENVVLRHNGIVKSQEDKREYRGLELSNRLKVMLVSDPSTDKSAAALDVNVGYLSDPEELPGLAHFCEHMLFLGTKKYPEENEYSKFLSEHGGSSNASTSSDHTTYYFDVLPAHLARALDIFAQFFISPLFTEGATGRELNAVNSEHEKNTSSDTWRLDQLNKNSADPKHPYHKFGTGNKQTLETTPKEKGIDVRKELLKFHDKWYSSNIMTLVVIGKESLDELESMVVPLFSQILDESVSAPTWPEHPFPPHLRRKITYCVPVKDLRSLSIDFPVPDTRKYYKTSPGHYLSHLLGHEGPGSLLSLLKEKGWCNSLVGGTRVGARGFAFFGVQVDLTEEGMQHTDDIVQLVFEYIAMLRKAGAQRWIWEEQKDIMAMEFRFKDTQEPRSVVTSHVHLMQEFPIEDVLSAYYIVSEWKPELIDQLMSLLTPENCRIGVVAKSFESKCTETEPWYGTKYIQEDIEEALIKKWKSVSPHPSLHLPPPNEFIPTSVEVVHPRQSGLCHSAPAIVRDTAMCRLWHKPDKYYALPKAVNTFDFISPLAYSDPLNCGLTSLWALLLRDSLQQTAYAAELAGLSWRIGNAKHGLTLYIDGYDSKQHVLLEKIIDQLVDFKIDPQRFEIMKENHIRGIRNFDAEQPYQHAVYQQALCLSDVVWTKCQLLDAAEEMTPEKLKDFTERFMRKVHVEGLIYGNITKEKAIELMESIEKRLPKDATPLLAQQLLLTREIELDKGIEFLRESTNSVHKSSCSCVYYAAGPRELRRNVSLELLAQITSEPCFNVLRTKEQLGYMVFSGVRRANGAQGLRILVQGDKPPAVLEERVEAFMLSLENVLKEMSEEEFLKHRAALAAQRLETPKRLSTNAAIIWGEIASQAYNFDRARVEVEQLNTITKEELIEFYKNTISDETKRRKLCVRIASTANENGDSESSKQNGNDSTKDNSSEGSRHQQITDLVDFKSRRKLYPQTTPYTNIPRKGAHCKL